MLEYKKEIDNDLLDLSVPLTDKNYILIVKVGSYKIDLFIEWSAYLKTNKKDIAEEIFEPD